MKLSRLSAAALAALLLGAGLSAADAACPPYSGLGSPPSTQRLLGTETADQVVITGGCIDGFVGQNLIQNGDFSVDARHEGAAVTLPNTGNPTMTVDRWQGIFINGGSGAGTPTVQQQALSSGLVLTSKEVLLTTSPTASANIPAGLLLALQQQIEGSDLEDAGFGVGGGQYTSMLYAAVWLKSSVAIMPTTGSLGLSFRNAALTRSYVANCTPQLAATYLLCTAQVPADTAGAWNIAPGTIGLIVAVTADCGATYAAPSTGAWQSGNYLCGPLQTHLTQTAGATLEIAAVGLYRGGMAPYFQPDPAPVAAAKLQRFYRKTFPPGTAPADGAGLLGARCVNAPAVAAKFGPGIAGGPVSLRLAADPPMFATPAALTFNPLAPNGNWRDVTSSLDVAPLVDASLLAGFAQPGAKSATGVTIGSVNAPQAGDLLCIHATLDTGY